MPRSSRPPSRWPARKEPSKTAQQAAIHGATAGEQLDPCYHQACDTFANVDLGVLDLNADAVAAAVLSFGMNTVAVNAAKGMGRFKPGKPVVSSAGATM